MADNNVPYLDRHCVIAPFCIILECCMFVRTIYVSEAHVELTYACGSSHEAPFLKFQQCLNPWNSVALHSGYLLTLIT